MVIKIKINIIIIKNFKNQLKAHFSGGQFLLFISNVGALELDYMLRHLITLLLLLLLLSYFWNISWLQGLFGCCARYVE